MKILIFFLFYSLAQLAFTQEEKPYFSLFNRPKKGSSTYTFLSVNELKESPRADSKTKLVIPINSKITIDTMIEIDYSKPNYLPEYYRVKYKGKVGYLKNEALALTRFELPKFETQMLFKLHWEKADENSSGLQLHYKELYHDTLVYEKFFDLNGYLFQLDLTNSRGLDSIENLLIIDYIAEACGEQGGEDIYSWSPSDIKLVAEFNEVGDAGVYNYTEYFVFPADSGGISKKLLYYAEEYNLYDEESEWFSEVKTQRIYNWISGEIVPPFKRDPNPVIETEEE